MVRYYLGADIGSSKTRVMIADEDGSIVGFGEGGPGNHETVGFDGLSDALHKSTTQALNAAGINVGQVAGVGLGVSGYDWQSQRQPILNVIQTLGFKAPLEIVNDSILGLLAGSTEGWGLALVSGTGCNCRGWDRERKNEGRVTGGGGDMGEGAGASELVAGAQKALAHEYTGRGPATGLTPALVQYAGARDLPDLLEGLMQGKYHLDAAAAPVIFKVALEGDATARELIEWAGSELGELAKAVIRQLGFQRLSFDVVLVGSMFDGGEILINPLRRSIVPFAPGARLIRLVAPPVVGAVLLGMEQAGMVLPASLRQKFLTDAAKLNSR